MNFFNDLMRAVLPSPSAWRLGTSRSAEVTGGTPIARLYIGATGGTLYMGMGDNSIYVPYPYVGGGVGAGVGFSPPLNASVATTDFPSTGGEWGRVYVPPSMLASADMNRDTIAGSALLIAPGVQFCAVGAGFSVILFGVGPSALTITNPFGLFNQTKGIAFQAGLTGITPSVGASCTAYLLRILPGGGIVNMGAAAPSSASRGFAKHLR